ncbi:MAG: hypothetical protein RLZZ01_270 [Actinomycetota bacterium]|jgi:hypothetical protein
MSGFSNEAEARLEFVRRIRNSLEHHFLQDGVTVEELEKDAPAITELAGFVLEAIGYRAVERDDGWVLVIEKRP